MISLQNFYIKVYLRGHYNVAVMSLLQLKREVWLNSNNAFLHTSKRNKKCVSYLQGLVRRPDFPSKTIHDQTGLGGPLSYCKTWPSPTEKRDSQAFLVGWDGGGRRGAMQERSAQSHHLLVPRGKELPRTAASTTFLHYIRHNSVPQEKLRTSKHVALTPADLCGAP